MTTASVSCYLALLLAACGIDDRDAIVTVRSVDPTVAGRTHWIAVSEHDELEVTVLERASDPAGGEVVLAIDRALCASGARLAGDVPEVPDVDPIVLALRDSACRGETTLVPLAAYAGKNFVSSASCGDGNYSMCSSTGVLWCYHSKQDYWYTNGTCTRI